MLTCLFEPGDGYTYEVVAATLTAAELAQLKRRGPSILFGFGVRRKPPMAAGIFPIAARRRAALLFSEVVEQLAVEKASGPSWGHLLSAAHQVLLHLTGRTGEPGMTPEEMGWHADWRDQLSVADLDRFYQDGAKLKVAKP